MSKTIINPRTLKTKANNFSLNLVKININLQIKEIRTRVTHQFLKPEDNNSSLIITPIKEVKVTTQHRTHLGETYNNSPISKIIINNHLIIEINNSVPLLLHLIKVISNNLIKDNTISSNHSIEMINHQANSSHLI